MLAAMIVGQAMNLVGYLTSIAKAVGGPFAHQFLILSKSEILEKEWLIVLKA
jgi:hypothetical protein